MQMKNIFENQIVKIEEKFQKKKWKKTKKSDSSATIPAIEITAAKYLVIKNRNSE